MCGTDTYSSDDVAINLNSHSWASCSHHILTLTTSSRIDDVTLVSVTGVMVDAAQRALQRSMKNLSFAKTLLFASEPPSALDARVEWIAIPPMNLREYSRFILQDLHRHIHTSHVLIVQADGFVINPERWDPAWLGYDYIGAPWPEEVMAGPYRIRLKNRVGNGGFSLRSRRLLELSAPIDLSTLRFPTRNEDMIICHVLHDYLTVQGIRFADTETAARFSIESDKSSFGQTLTTSFGFHGRDYLARLSEMQPTTS